MFDTKGPKCPQVAKAEGPCIASRMEKLEYLLNDISATLGIETPHEPSRIDDTSALSALVERHIEGLEHFIAQAADIQSAVHQLHSLI